MSDIEELKLSNGYRAIIDYDQAAENPFTASDCEPPIAVLNTRSKADTYGSPQPDLESLVSDLVDGREDDPALWERVFTHLGLDPEYHLDDYTAYTDPDSPLYRDTHALVTELVDTIEVGKRRYYEAVVGICAELGIPAKLGCVRGYCQRDWAYVFVWLPKEWFKLTGAAVPEDPEDCEWLQSTLDLFGWWAFGDVYMITSLLRPDSTEVDDAVCAGFYGPDHEVSGLKSYAECYVQYDMQWLAAEEAEATAMACRDILTVP